MKVIILAGGFGTRIAEEPQFKGWRPGKVPSIPRKGNDYGKQYAVSGV